MVARGLPGIGRWRAGPAVGVLGGLRPDPRRCARCGPTPRPSPAAIRMTACLAARTAHSQWWHALAGWEGPAPGQPRSIRALAARSRPRSSFLLALSAAYLDACRDDIAGASQPGALTRTRFMVVSAGARYPGSTRRGHGASRRPAASSAWAAPGRRSTPGSPPTCCPPGSAAAPTQPGTWRDCSAQQPTVRRYERKKLSDAGSPRPDRRRPGPVARRRQPAGCCASSGTPDTPASRDGSASLHRLVHGERDMNSRAEAPVLARRALRITQAD